MATVVEGPTRYRVPVGAKGRMVLPAAVRERMGLRAGDQVLVEVDADGEVRLRALSACARAAIGMYAGLAPGVSLADELNAERRRDAERE